MWVNKNKKDVEQNIKNIPQIIAIKLSFAASRFSNTFFGVDSNVHTTLGKVTNTNRIPATKQ